MIEGGEELGSRKLEENKGSHNDGNGRTRQIDEQIFHQLIRKACQYSTYIFMQLGWTTGQVVYVLY
jgi:hypothetical protein